MPPLADTMLSKGRRGDVVRLAARHGTPLLLFYPNRLHAALESYRRHLRTDRALYAVKSNPDPQILAELVCAGVGFETVAPSEIASVLAAGASPDTILYAHPVKKPSDIQLAAEMGVRAFVVDTCQELDKIISLSPDAQVLVRIGSPGRSRFGADLEELESIIERAPADVVVGLAFHDGPYRDPEAAASSLAKRFAELEMYVQVAALKQQALSVIDLGGGLFPYTEYHAPTYDLLNASLGRLRSHMPDLQEIWTEPGRALSANCMDLVISVVGSKRVTDRMIYYIDDSTYGSFLDRRLINRDFRFIPVERGGPTQPSTLLGATCCPTDIIAEWIELPELFPGDLLISPALGSYSKALTDRFNGIARPSTVAVY